ncbi:MAG: winged helix-turn-helix domain-containing protein [Phycisphaerales bacterium]|nr:winged helix-turn-helix domain-containing protein [Phycisphaerales bacterium]
MSSKKTTSKKTTKTAKATKPRMSTDAARAKGAAKVKAALGNGKKPKAAKPAKERRPSGLDLAAKVLAASKEPLAAKTISERTIAAGWKTSGKTPHATLYAAIIREIAAKGSSARFKKTDRGLFTAHAGAK